MEDDEQSRVYGLGLKGRLARVTLLRVFLTDHLIRRRKWMRPFTDSLKHLIVTGPGSCRGFQTS